MKTSAKPKRGAQTDWSAAPAVDRSKLETGAFKFSAEGSRSQERISHRELGMVSVALLLPDKQTWVDVKLWDFTSLSFGIFCTTGNSGTAPSHPLSGLSRGDEIEMRIRISQSQEFRIGCQVKNISPFKAGVKIGLRRLDLNLPHTIEVERRESLRLPLAPTLALNARIRHPFIYGYWCPLQVSDMNKNMGLSFLSRDPSILIFTGMEMPIHFEMANHRERPMIGRVTWVHASDGNQIKFGVACVDMDWKLHNGICDFLLFSKQWTPGRLREAGFQAKLVKSRLRFRSVKTMSDYSEVLHLRRDTYVAAGKKPPGTRPEEMAGNLDGQSRILMAHHHDKLVATVSFTFPNSEDTILDSQAGFPGQKYPILIPPRTNLIEVSRLCIHEEYRSTDLLQGMFEHGIKHFLLSDRHWLLTSAVADLLPLYLRIGFTKLNASYHHKALNNQEHYLILAHRSTFLYGKGMNLLVWNALFGDLVRHLVNRKLINVPSQANAIIRMKLQLHAFSKWILERKAGGAFRKHLEIMRLADQRKRSPDPGK
ncbi:MAG: GNAT family N-acyltransferase [Fibrobacteria bacterium]